MTLYFLSFTSYFLLDDKFNISVDRDCHMARERVETQRRGFTQVEFAFLPLVVFGLPWQETRRGIVGNLQDNYRGTARNL